MNLFQALTEKPWEVEGEIAQPGGEATYQPPAYTALKWFLAVATVVFSLSVVSYADRMSLPDWRPLAEPWLLWPNTVILVLSSLALHWTVVNARRGDVGGLRLWLIVGGVLAMAFLIGQLAAWRQLDALGFYAADNPANAFFYMLTGLHGVHLLGGLVAWGRTMAKVRRGVEIARLGASAELCAIYWHFMLAIWLILFCLMMFT